MSEFVECETKIKSQVALIEALVEQGWKKDQIEVHEEAQNLYGYQGDRRQQKANIIIRKKNIGGSSNDVGFVKQKDGTFKLMVSAYDRGYHCRFNQNRGFNDAWLHDFTTTYNEKHLTRVGRKLGFQVKKKKKKNGMIVLTLVKP